MSSNESTHARRRIPWKTGLAVLAVVAAGAGWAFRGGEDVAHVTFTVKRGPLDIRVLEGGNVQALESQQIRSEVRGYPGTKILSIIEEGYFVTQQDVEDELVLVELDSSELQDKLTTELIQIKGTEATLTEARQAYDIQLNQSESDIYSAGIELKFARMEMEKYLGQAVTEKLLVEAEAFEGGAGQHSVQNEVDARVTANVSGEGEAESQRMQISLNSLKRKLPELDFGAYADPELLGQGEANQQLRKLEDDYLLAQQELGAAKAGLAGSERLYKRDFITKLEYDNKQLEYRKREIAVVSAEAARDLFVRYEFPKQSEQLFSDYVQKLRALQRTEKKALSELASAEAKLLSAEARYRIQQERIAELEEQIGFCTMRAERAGLVVYGGGDNRIYYGQDEQIKEGTVIRERQTIITIPDMTKMGVKVKIHESDIKRVKVGQTAAIRVEAQTDTPLQGTVTKVGVLPDSEDRWLNPDLKVYETVIAIEGTHEWLKPGMSAEVDIQIKTLPDTLYIPVQSVVPQGGKQVCFVVENGEVTPREIETGELTVEHIAVSSGLEAGEQVLLRPPEGSRQDTSEEEGADTDTPVPEDAPEMATAGMGAVPP